MGTPQLDDEWLTDLFGRHSRAVLAYARRRLDSAEDAEDVVVEVFATAWRRREVVPDEALPWLYATAGNVIAHVIRSDSRRTRLGAKLATVRPLHSPEMDPAQQLVDAATAHDVVSAALDDLSESDAELLRLWAWEQLEPAEIAEVLGCSPGTARTRMHRARARLREALVQRGVSGPAVTVPGVTPAAVTGADVDSSEVTGPGTQHPPDATASPDDTLTTPHGSEATR
jgi:RNA polymerase sigma-70 factor (ECF subfamily)